MPFLNWINHVHDCIDANSENKKIIVDMVCGYDNIATLLTRSNNMYFDRFDIVEAYFLAFCHCHGGQWSREYARMSKMNKYFKPSPLLSVESLSDNGKMIYVNACAKLLKK